MPNHITNRIRFEGSEKDIAELVEKYSTYHEATPNKSYDGKTIYKKVTGDGRFDYDVGWLDEESNTFSQRDKEDVNGVPNGFEVDIEDAWTRFPDFNKIVPMPDSLSIEIHHGIINAIKNALQVGVHENELIGRLEDYNRKNQDSPLTFNDEDWEMFIKGLNNMKKHGHIYWYDWANENWGTKWNSYSCRKEGGMYLFETAWSNVGGLIELISNEFKEVKIFYDWADGDTGSNCGNAVFIDGLVTINEPESQSKEAYEIAFDLSPDKKEWYELIDGEYQHKEE